MGWHLVGHYCHQRHKLNFCVRKGNRCFQPTMAVSKNTDYAQFINLFISSIFSFLRED